MVVGPAGKAGTLMTVADTATLRRMCWIFPDRESTRATAMWHDFFWDVYAEVAADLDLSWTMHSPDAVTVDHLTPGRPRVYVEDELVTPADTLFITALYSLPYQSAELSTPRFAGSELPMMPSAISSRQKRCRRGSSFGG